jgi:hypothetical protein
LIDECRCCCNRVAKGSVNLSGAYVCNEQIAMRHSQSTQRENIHGTTTQSQSTCEAKPSQAKPSQSRSKAKQSKAKQSKAKQSVKQSKVKQSKATQSKATQSKATQSKAQTIKAFTIYDKHLMHCQSHLLVTNNDQIGAHSTNGKDDH